MKIKELTKYLGDQLSGLGLAESVAATVWMRKGLVCKAMFDIRTFGED